MKLNYFLFTVLSFSLMTSFGQNTKKKVELKPVPVESTSSPKFRTAQQPMVAKNSNPTTFKKSGVNGNEIIGEGAYLNFDKKIMMYSVDQKIPTGFPKHVIGQSKEEYVQIMKQWALEHPDQFIKLSDYMNYEESIKERTVSGQIPADFPKYKFGQSAQQYETIMKEWGKNHLDQIKPQYWPNNK